MWLHEAKKSELRSEQSPKVLGFGAAGALLRGTGGFTGAAADQLQAWRGLLAKCSFALPVVEEGRKVGERGPAEKTKEEGTVLGATTQTAVLVGKGNRMQILVLKS